LILVGMMGSGKTTIGRLLSTATGLPYIDNDDLLDGVAARTAREIAVDGDVNLRIAESAALLRGLATPPPCIVGAAAGTILDPVNRRAISEAGTVVWLRGRPETLARRAVRGTHRPWLQGDALGWFRKAVREREPLYSSIADVRQHVDESPLDAVVTRLLAQPLVAWAAKSGR
jgi:shikimate kinase